LLSQGSQPAPAEGDRKPSQRIRFGDWAQGRAHIHALVIVNEAAGSVGPGGQDKLLAELEGLGARTSKAVSNLDQLCEGDAEGVDLIVVLGGDGTASKAASMFPNGPPLVLLPGGTRSLLPHALYGLVGWPEALRAALTHGRVTTLAGGEANGRKFFVAALFGAPTLLARAREAARSGRLDLMMSRLKQVFTRMFARRIAVRPLGGVATRAEAAGVLCPAHRGEIEGQSLEWVRLNAPQILDFVRVGVRSVMGGWREDPAIELSLSASGEIRAIGTMPAVLDGEPTTFKAHVRLRMLTDGPKVLVTR
jgi:diacylglycerol kinase family enzyme